MKWVDTAIVLGTHIHGEHGMVLKALTREHGLHAGMVRSRKKDTSLCQQGNVLQLTWNARMEEHLGTYACEPHHHYAHHIMGDRLTTYGLTSLTALLNKTLPERYPCPDIYDAALHLLESMANGHSWLADYIRFELNLLSWLGYGLELRTCADTGRNSNLTHVSPRSGQAVCAQSATPYLSKLLRLPSFLQATAPQKHSSYPNDMREYIDGITLTRYFLNKYIFIPQQRTLPMPCTVFQQRLVRTAHHADGGV